MRLAQAGEEWLAVASTDINAALLDALGVVAEGPRGSIQILRIEVPAEEEQPNGNRDSTSS